MTQLLSPPGRRAVHIGRYAGTVSPRAVLVGLAGLALTAVVAVYSIGHGSFTIAPGDVVDTLLGGGTPAQKLIVLDLRLPRILTALLVGAALAISGALTQTFARNPLASPDVLGVTHGASLGAVAVIVAGGGAAIGMVPLAALAGALVTATLVYVLAWRRGIDGFRLVLVGIGVGEVVTAGVSWFLVRAEIVDATRATIWLNGSVAGAEWDQVRPLSIGLAVLIPLAVATAFTLQAMQFDDDVARSLGVRLQAARLAVVLTAVALAAAAVAAAGPIEFVAFVVPQIALRLCGGSRPPLIVSAVLGALLVAVADLAARLALPERELPVGLVTAMVGAPYLLWLLIRTNRRVSA
ncbi:iron chelate uptake ABC transporter family permease subunit [Actinoplanes sp. LDG1-06]|uniref:Iron chelate uptake ABC transporter family permease subunit n=1 Tax=Paractinoplanes ovalisporus TaxID=2810368 RepID=A0ABS2AA32_9ACTN|nr:iron chelate uptake ABC transporter family permease subunit [Actinoplanes ovalisporus]MBM2616690.1 iron chelate uptake ABC transporter family permease subunit [Actinoplanes ovalisporus]